MSANWVRQACVRLELSDGSTIVLVRGAKVHHLRPAVLGLHQALGRPEVAFSVADFLRLKPGSVALLCVKRDELPRLNEVRPVAQQRGLRLLLMPLESQGGVAAARNGAPDFLDWVSHVVEADTNIPEVVRTGIEAARGILPGVVWHGPPLGHVFERLGISYERLSATQRHDALDEAIRTSHAEAILWTDAAARFERRRIEWVLALAAKRPSWSMIEGTAAPTAWPVVDARTSDPWRLLGEGRSHWDVAHSGGALTRSIESQHMVCVGEDSLPFPTATGEDAARLALDEFQVDTAEFVLENQPEPDPTLLARLLALRGDDEDAAEMLESTVEDGGASQTAAPRLQALGNIYTRQGKFDEAEQAFRQALSAYESAYGRNDPRRAGALHGLGYAYDRQSKNEQAERAYRQALDLFEGSPSPHPGTTASLQGLGNLYERQGRYDEAEQAFQEALDFSEKLYGTTLRADAAAPLHGLGNVYTVQGRFAEAEAAFLRAVEMQSTRNPDLTSALTSCRLGDVYAAQGKYAEAEEAYRRSLRILEDVHKGKLHPSRAPALQGLVNVYNRQGRYAEASRALYEATRLPADSTKK